MNTLGWADSNRQISSEDKTYILAFWKTVDRFRAVKTEVKA